MHCSPPIPLLALHHTPEIWVDTDMLQEKKSLICVDTDMLQPKVIIMGSTTGGRTCPTNQKVERDIPARGWIYLRCNISSSRVLQVSVRHNIHCAVCSRLSLGIFLLRLHRGARSDPPWRVNASQWKQNTFSTTLLSELFVLTNHIVFLIFHIITLLSLFYLINSASLFARTVSDFRHTQTGRSTKWSPPTRW